MTVCRRNAQALLQTLSKALQTHPTAEVYNKLAELVDYLDLPDPVQQLLPSLSMISIQHLPVLDLHYYALSRQAVDLMLNSTAFTISSSSTWKSNAAYFFVSARETDGQLSGVSVYAVGGGNLQEPSWACTDLQGSANSNIDAGRDLTAVLLNPRSSCTMTSSVTSSFPGSIETDAGKSNSRQQQQQQPESLPFWDVARTDSSNGSVLVKGISQNHKCFGCHLEALMTKATEGICSFGRSGGVRAACGCVEHRAGGYMYEVGVANLWVVYW